jgi:hypothetical protein
VKQSEDAKLPRVTEEAPRDQTGASRRGLIGGNAQLATDSLEDTGPARPADVTRAPTPRPNPAPEVVAPEPRQNAAFGAPDTAKKPAAKDDDDNRERISQLVKQCESAAARSDCAAVRVLAQRIRSSDESTYKTRVLKNTAIARCLE